MAKERVSSKLTLDSLPHSLARSEGGRARGGTQTVPTPEQCSEMGRTCACFNLRRAARAVTQLFDMYFDLVGLKATQFIVLAALMNVSNDSEKSPTVTELAETLILDQSSLSRNLGVLERLGYIRLVPGADRRERMVTLTRSGRTALARGYPVWGRAQSAVTEMLEAREFETQLRSLRRITKSALGLRPSKPRERQARGRADRSETGAEVRASRMTRAAERNGTKNGTKSGNGAASRARRVT